MAEIGTWTHAQHLAITYTGVQQLINIRKHLQVVTREVLLNQYDKTLDGFS
jgi:hypothetical protein